MPDRVIAITGAFGALGRRVAAVASKRGHALALIDRAAAAPPGLEGSDTLLLPAADLSSSAGTAAAIAAIKTRFGRLDALLNIAGAFKWMTLADSRDEDWDELYRVNVLTCANMCRAALPLLKASGTGRIVNVGAGAAAGKAGAGMGAYAASKAGVHKLTEALADELKGDSVTVNAVLPSTIDTPANRKDMPEAKFDTWVRAEELAEVMLFLASPEASGITGALIPVSGRV